MKKKVFVVLGIAFGVVITAGISFSLALSLVKFNSMETQNSELKDELKDSLKKQIVNLKEELLENEKEKEDTEQQYVMISGCYKIMDTSNISNAYKSKDTSSLSDTDKETLKLASDVLKKITNDKMNLYEKEVAIHDWMVKNIKYDSNSLVAVTNNENGLHTPHGVLKNKKAVCVGFATTFKLLMNMLDAECMVVHSDDLSHSWDLVKLEDGQWYLTDITFDAGNTYVSYANFNCSQDLFAGNHQWNQELYPKAEGRKYNYCVQMAKPVKDIKKLAKTIKTATKAKKTNLFYLLPKDVDETYISNLSDGISSRVYNDMDFSAYYTQNETGQIVMAISIFYKDNTNATDVELDALNSNLDELFGPIL